MKKYKLILLLIPLILIFILSSSDVIKYIFDSHKNKQLNNNLLKEISAIPSTNNINNTPLDSVKSELSARKALINDLKESNISIIGWLYVYDTKIDYPILQSTDNDFYLYNDYTNTESKYGSIFLDYRNDINNIDIENGENLIIYGHNMKDKQMFGSLDKFSDLDFFSSTIPIGLILGNNEYYFEAFSSYVTSTDDNYIQTQFEDSNEYLNFVNNLKEKSYYASSENDLTSNFILTLSTCSFIYDDARLAVHCKLIE